MDNLRAMPDWEAECKRLTEENEVLKAKLCDMDFKFMKMEKELSGLRAQMDIVYLIFGKR